MNRAAIGFMISAVLLFAGVFAMFLSTQSDENLETTAQGRTSKIEYHGHSYVVWSVNLGGGIVHDPDCACGKGEE